MTDTAPKIIIIPPKQEDVQAQAAKKHLRVAAYCRVSTDDEEQLTSYEAQMSYYTQKITKTPEWTMTQVFADEGITGTSVKSRKDFQRMIRQCRQGKIDLILTKSLSRFSRNTLDVIKYTRELRNLGVSVIFEKENINSIYPESEFLITLYGAFAQSESESISKNVSWGKRQAMKAGTPYKRCTWARNGKKRIVWRCISRLEFGKQYCHDSPTLDEDKLHKAIVAALNQYGAIRNEVEADTLELAGLAQNHGVNGGVSLLDLRQRLEALTAEQNLLLDEILKDMDNLELNAQLKALSDEKRNLLEQIQALEKDGTQQALQASRQQEMKDWLENQPLCFTDYDDTITRMFVEKITVEDAETILVKIRDIDVVIEQKMC